MTRLAFQAQAAIIQASCVYCARNMGPVSQFPLHWRPKQLVNPCLTLGAAPLWLQPLGLRYPRAMDLCSLEHCSRLRGLPSLKELDAQVALS